MADGKAILAGLAGLTKGIAEGLKLRQERELQERKLTMEQARADQDLRASALKSQIDIDTAASRNNYYKNKMEQDERRTRVLEKGANIKSSTSNKDTTKGLNDEATKADKLVEDSFKTLRKLESSANVKSSDPKKRELYDSQLKEAQDNYQKVKNRRDAIYKKLQDTEKASGSSEEVWKSFDRVKSVESLDDYTIRDLESLEGSDRQAAIDMLIKKGLV